MLRPILSKDPTQRTTQEVKQTQKCFLTNEFFINIKKTRDEKTYFDLCEKLGLEEHDKGSIVFNDGDIGKYFYVILSGAVEVRVSGPVQLEQDSATPEGLISFIILYFEDINWKEIVNGSMIV